MRPRNSYPYLALPLCLFLGVLLSGCVLTNSPIPPTLESTVRVLRLDDKFEGDFGNVLQKAPSDQSFQALVDLTQQVDPMLLSAWILAYEGSSQDRNKAVREHYAAIAKQQQAALIPELEAQVDAGTLDYWRPLTVVNRVLVEGSAAGILKLSEHPSVGLIRPEWRSNQRRKPAGRMQVETNATPLGEEFKSWAIEAMNVEFLYGLGLTGEGIHIAAIDTGVRGNHIQLKGRSAPPPAGFYDPVEGRTKPWDSHWHGTGILSVALGADEKQRVGVAPQSRWSMALANYRNHYSRWRMSLAAEWIFQTAKPDVLVNAWSNNESPCTTFDLPFINAWQLSGIFVIFPAGNAGPAAGTGEAPAQLTGAAPLNTPVFSVGSTRPGEALYKNSSRGPSPCGSEVFPILALPGEDIPHAFSSGDAAHSRSSGTSFSAGLLAGGVALLLEAAPDVPPWELQQILIETTIDRGPEGIDPGWGYGELNLEAAYGALKARGYVRFDDNASRLDP